MITRAFSFKDADSRLHIDWYLLLTGLLFVAMPLLELYYAGNQGDRNSIKILNGLQVVVALSGIIASGDFSWIRHRVMTSFFFFFLYLCVYEILFYEDIAEFSRAILVYCYWFFYLIFFYLRAYKSPGRVQLFLGILFVSLVLWVPAIVSSASGIMEAKGYNYRIQDNSGYYFVALLPFVLCIKSNKIKIIAFALISFGSVYSLKRGVIVALVLMGGSAAIVNYYYIQRVKSLTKLILIIIGVSSVFLAPAALFFQRNSDDVIRRIQSQTGREIIYAETLKNLGDADITPLVFGHINERIENKIGILPHNDWLYLLHDYGILGFSLLLYVYFYLYKYLKALCRLHSKLAIPLTAVIMLMVCVQMVSYGFFVKIFGLITGCIGLIVGLNRAHEFSDQTDQK